MNAVVKFALLVFVLALGVHAKADPGGTMSARVPVAVVRTAADRAVNVNQQLESACSDAIGRVHLSESAIGPVTARLETLQLANQPDGAKVTCQASADAKSAICSAICLITAEID